MTQNASGEKPVKTLNVDGWTKMMECLLSFEADPISNINRLAALCGELMEADCVLYNRLDRGLLCAWGQWQVPPDFRGEDNPAGHICYDIICDRREEPIVLRRLSESSYFDTDPNVRKYGLQTYIGKTVVLEGEHVGSLCAVYQHDVEPDEDRLRVIDVIARAVSVEEVRKREGETVRERKRLFRVLAELSPDAIALVSGEGQLQYMNKAAVKLFGEQSAWIGRQCKELFSVGPFSALDVELQLRRLKRALRQEKNLSFEEAIISPDGQVWIEEHLIPYRDAADNTLAVMLIIRNITERKLAYQRMEKVTKERTRELSTKNKLLHEEVVRRKETEKDLRRRENTFRSVVEHAVEMIFRLDLEYNCLYLNPAAKKMIDWPQKKDRRHATLPLFTDLLWKKMKSSLDTVIASGKQVLAEFDLKDIGREACLQASLIPEFDAGGQVVSILCVARDVYEMRKLEEELSRLERLNVIGEAAASIGHEIRNPMTVVRGFLQTLENKGDLAHYKSYFSLMIEEIDRANEIITEFLSLAKNKFVELKKCSLNEVITSILPLLQAEAIQNVQSIECNLSDLPDIFIDPKEIRQMLINLVRNAMEASKSGRKVWIATEAVNDEVILKIKDQGAGICPAVRHKIGLPFTTSKENGTGLGLAVCYSIAQRHNAKLNFKTGKKGTTFLVHFPA